LVQEKENFLWNSLSDLKEVQHYDLVKMLGLPILTQHAGAVCRGQTYMNCFGVL